jgi:glycosyltransferase involved in cell wall biosynthesis
MANLLSINNYYYRRGGAEAVFLEQNRLFEEIGWRVAPFAMRHPNNIPTEWDTFFVDEIEFGREYSLSEKISMATKVVYSFEAQRKLRLLMQRFQPDIAHLHCIYHHLSPSIIPVLSEAGIPVVMTAHDLKIACPAYKMLNNGGICERCRNGNLLNVVRHRCVRNSVGASAIVSIESLVHRYLNTYKKNLNKVIVPSRFFIEKFVEWGWPREKFVYIPNYVNASQFTPSFTPGDYFLYVGRLAPEKGIETLMAAAAFTKGIKLKIAGTGPLETKLRMLQRELRADIDLVGHHSGKELHNLIRDARAVVLPSEWYENAPMSVLESFALGKPVIGADIGGIPEMVIDNETGWRFASGDLLDLSRVLGQVATMTDERVSAIGENARRFVEKRFNQADYIQAMLSLYRELGIRS